MKNETSCTLEDILLGVGRAMIRLLAIGLCFYAFQLAIACIVNQDHLMDDATRCIIFFVAFLFLLLSMGMFFFPKKFIGL